MMRRRDVLGFLGSLAANPSIAPATYAENSRKMLLVGMATIVPRSAPHIVAFVTRMTELGYREGVDFALEHVRVAALENYQTGFRELAARQVNTFVVFGNEKAASAARAAAGGKPIILVALTFDPVEKGFAQSLARPGSNITGLFAQQVELAAKRVEFIHETVPAFKLNLMFDAASADQGIAALKAAESMKAQARLLEVKGQPPDYPAAMDGLSGLSGDAVVITETAIFARDRNVLFALVSEHQIPAIGALREDAEAGALMSYGVNLLDALRRAADYVDRIAKGATPSDLPIEQPTKFELVINLKTAKALGITLPQSLLARADEVIE